MYKEHSEELELITNDNRRLVNFCGKLDQNIRQIEESLDVRIYLRGARFQISGAKQSVKIAVTVMKDLFAKTIEKDNFIKPKDVYISLKEHSHPNCAKDRKSAGIKLSNKLIKTRNLNQDRYIENILRDDINFGIGPAGTGKTFLAVACAVHFLERELVKRIILVRPAVEAGEKLGFLPGDLNQKIDPYLRPLYDALYELLGFELVTNYIENNIIEIAPLAYMRGRTLSDAFIILDEGQNTTCEQMKMFLTRIGFGSKAVITGDKTQIDLPAGKKSGLKEAISILEKVEKINFTFFNSRDVVRHPLVQKIVDAYSNHHINEDNTSSSKVENYET